MLEIKGMSGVKCQPSVALLRLSHRMASGGGGGLSDVGGPCMSGTVLSFSNPERSGEWLQATAATPLRRCHFLLHIEVGCQLYELLARHTLDDALTYF